MKPEHDSRKKKTQRIEKHPIKPEHDSRKKKKRSGWNDKGRKKKTDLVRKLYIVTEQQRNTIPFIARHRTGTKGFIISRADHALKGPLLTFGFNSRVLFGPIGGRRD